MSVYYDICEHLTIDNTERYGDVCANFISRLATLGANILCDNGHVVKLSLCTDGKEYTFSGDVMTQEYHQLIKALYTAQSLDLVWEYCYSWHSGCLDPAPFDLMKEIEQVLAEEPDYLDGLFYSVYNRADCATDGGILIAYGMKNGVRYHGIVPAVEADKLPEGDWYCPVDAVACDVDDGEGVDLEEIAKICRQLGSFQADMPTISPESREKFESMGICVDSNAVMVQDGTLSFYQGSLRIKNHEELTQYMALYAKLIALTDGQCSLIGELVDISGAYPRMCNFDVECDGSYTLKLTAIQE